MKIEKKIWPESFQKILDGKKKFELRLADWNCQEGDILILREWDPRRKDYTGRVLEKEVKYLIKTQGVPFWTEEEIKEHGFQVIGF